MVDDRAMAVEAAALAAGVLAIVACSQNLPAMTLLIPLLVALRFLAWSRLPDRHSLRAEIAFFVLCTVLGGTNDWISVHVRAIYSYEVPAAFPDWSAIPLWMLLFWGVILRFVTALTSWDRLGAPRGPDRVTGRRIVFLLALVFATRSRIYRDFGDPILSWAPFAAALLAYALIARPTRHDLTVGGLFLIGGPLVESVLIRGGGLHHYELGVLAGVPIWIALWWVLAVLVWKDLGGRLLVAATRHCGQLRVSR